MESLPLKEQLAAKGLKVTHQRLCILEAIHTLKNHPTADQIIKHVRPNFPTIATGTVYKILDTLIANDLVNLVQHGKDVMRYDADVNHRHHHLHCQDCDAIMDYENEALDALLANFFEQHHIPNFAIDTINLQIQGRITHPTNNTPLK